MDESRRALRNALFANVVRQEFAFFDDPANSPFAISSRLADDTDLVSKAYGNPLASICDTLTGCTLGFGIAFFSSWQITLVVIVIVPAGVYFSKLQRGLGASVQRKSQALVAKASSVAGDAVDGISTVMVFGMQERVQQMYQGVVARRTREGLTYSLGVARAAATPLPRPLSRAALSTLPFTPEGEAWLALSHADVAAVSPPAPP